MSLNSFDPEILQDFLTECGELLSQLETDLVVLESSPGDTELINQVFRALHTIKGSASFLALTPLVEVAHAAESALNMARSGQAAVDRAMMDMLLEAVDAIKQQFVELSAGEPLTSAKPALVAGLAAIGAGPGHSSASHAAAATQTLPEPQAGSSSSDWPRETPLELPPEKRDLVEYLIADLDETLAGLQRGIDRLRNDSQRGDASAELQVVADELSKSLDFFGCEQSCSLARAVEAAVAKCPDLDPERAKAMLPFLEASLKVLDDQKSQLARGVNRQWPIESIVSGLANLVGDSGNAAAASLDQLLQEVGLIARAAAPTEEEQPGDEHAETTGSSQPGSGGADEPAKSAKPAANVEATIRVEVDRLEALMNLVGELVLQKNRVAALSRQVGTVTDVPQQLHENFLTTSGALDRITTDIQVAVMRTRMQPLDKLFGKYPRLIRDLAKKTGKRLKLTILGGDTEVDKSVIDHLADPLVHLLRNSADHGVEMPEDREKAGKHPEGNITLSACHRGGNVLVSIADDGKGLHRDVLAKKAVEKGIVTAEAVAAMSDKDVYNLIFAAGFSTADKVSDLSGRGVGMDVVRTNIEKIKGSIDLQSTPGVGTTINIQIPLTIAIMSAMLVGVGEEIYAVPLGNIVEIVKPKPEQLSTIRERPVMRLRESILPLVTAEELLESPHRSDGPPPFAVVLTLNERRIGLMVSRLIGQQEIVIKSLDAGTGSRHGAVSGATVRDDGGVSLIIDVARLFDMTTAPSFSGD